MAYEPTQEKARKNLEASGIDVATLSGDLVEAMRRYDEAKAQGRREALAELREWADRELHRELRFEDQDTQAAATWRKVSAELDAMEGEESGAETPAWTEVDGSEGQLEVGSWLRSPMRVSRTAPGSVWVDLSASDAVPGEVELRFLDGWEVRLKTGGESGAENAARRAPSRDDNRWRYMVGGDVIEPGDWTRNDDEVEPYEAKDWECGPVGGLLLTVGGQILKSTPRPRT